MPVPRLVVFLLAASLLSGCAEGDPETVQTPSPTATPRSNQAASPRPTSTLPPGVDHLVRVTVRDGQVVGGAQRVRIPTGDVVRLVVTSDVADEVHLHTYDKKVDVAAGGTATLTFTASIPGVITAELEGTHLTLVRLQVQ